MKKYIFKSAKIVAASSSFNPIISTIVVASHYCAFNLVEAAVETLLTGERFLHVGDIVAAFLFTAFNGYVIYLCAIHNLTKELEE